MLSVFLRKLTNEKLKTGSRNALMRQKILDASREKQHYSNQYKAGLRYLNRRWGQFASVVAGFNRVLQEETVAEWERIREKHRKKLWFLTGKKLGGKPREETGDYKGVLISEEQLKSRFQAPEIKVINDQGVQLSEAEESILRLHPKFSVYEGISVYKTKVNTEVAIDKLRWSKRSERGVSP